MGLLRFFLRVFTAIFGGHGSDTTTVDPEPSLPATVPHNPVAPDPVPPPEPDPIVPITLGNWKGNFLYPASRYFAPAVCARPEGERRAYFAEEVARGYTHVLINAEQDDWGIRNGHPDWTSGGFNAYAPEGMPQLIEVLWEAREAGLIPMVGVIDQPTLEHLDLDTIIARTQQLVDSTHEDVCLYMLSWELNEVWGSADERNPNIHRWVNEVNWHGRDVGIHYAPPPLGNTDWEGEEDHVHGGYGLYEDLPPNVVRMAQFPNEIDDDSLTLRCRLGCEVNMHTNTKYCAFEHSGWHRRDPPWSEEDCTRRADICRSVMSMHFAPEQCGSMNG